MDEDFDPIVLLLVLTIRLAPRRLMVETAGGSCYCDLIGMGDYSILAGCIFSVDLSKLVMARVLNRVILRFPEQPFQTWVDDLFLHMASRCPTTLAISLHFAMVVHLTRSSLAISGLDMSQAKSVALAGSKILKESLAKSFKRYGLRMLVAATGKDLGLDINLGRKRSIRTQKKRFLGAVARSLRVRKLIGKTKFRSTGKLHRTGVFPKARWGVQACGMSPSAVLLCRQRYAVDNSLRRQGGCTGTAIQVDTCVEDDSLYFFTADLIKAWLAVAPTVKEAALERAWEVKVKKLRDPRTKQRWAKVTTMMEAVVATLVGLGWDPVLPWSWVDPNCSIWNIDSTDPLVALKVMQNLKITIVDAIAMRMEEHYLGKGLNGVLDTIAIKRQIRRLPAINPESAGRL